MLRYTAFPEEFSLHTDAAGPAPPDAFGPFRVLHQIGAGALGPVFRAYDPERDRLLAVKLFRLDLPPERVHLLVADFERLISAHPAHRAIVAPLATGIAGASAYLAVDYVVAESLDLTLRPQLPLATDEVLRVAAHVAAALDAGVAAGIDHGVLHPRDILVSGDEVRIAGLGVARALARVGIPTPVRRPYTAPERHTGSTWDRRADVFALAAIVHEMLWARRVAAIGRDAIAGLTPVDRGDLGRLRALFARALAEDPETRFDTAGEFASGLTRAFRIAGSRQPAAAGGHVPGRSEPRAAVGSAHADRTAAADAEAELPLGLPLTNTRDTAAQPSSAPEPVVVKGDFNLREPAARYADVEPVPAIAYATAPPPGTSAIDGYRFAGESPAPSTASRTSVAPLAFALVIGAALGFVAGFGVGTRGVSMTGADAAAAISETGPDGDENAAATTGTAREFTEGKVMPQPAASAQAGRAQPVASPRAAPGAPVAGSLLVRSTPTGAQVFVDGRVFGRTPVTVSNLARGLHTVRVVREGFVTDEQQVTITPSQRVHSMTVRLSAVPPAPAVAAGPANPPVAASEAVPVAASSAPLTVESRPSGARVFLDGKLVGTTPLLLDAVPVGEHAIHLERDGYQRWSAAVRVDASGSNRVAASLDR